jgi:hypothetical protein
MRRYLFALGGAVLVAGATCWAGDAREAAVWGRIAESRPPAEFLRWQTIPWLTDLAKGIRLAKAEKRPLLIWASGDDPLERC